MSSNQLQAAKCSSELIDLIDFHWQYSSFLRKSEQPSTSGREELCRVFAAFDADGDGFISKTDMAEIMKKLDSSISDHELDSTLSAVDLNDDGLISFEEFRTVFETAHHDTHEEHAEEEELFGVFCVFDADKDGFITAEELHAVLCNLGFDQGRKIKDCDNMIKNVDCNGDGQVDFSEFKQMMCRSLIYI